MSRKRRREKEAAEAPPARTPEAAPPSRGRELAPRAAWAWLAAAFLLPNLGALRCGFVLDDLPLIVDNGKLHGAGAVLGAWTWGYWPDRTGLTLYRPVTQGLWALLWSAGRGSPVPFHAANLALGLVVVLLLHRLLLVLGAERGVAFAASLLFALFPIHTEATTSVVGSAELLAAGAGLGALLLHRAGRRAGALLLFAAAVFSKESGAAVALLWAALLVLAPPAERPPLRRLAADAAAAFAVVAAALAARAAVAAGPSFIPPVDNPMALVDPFRRVLTALWVQLLYLQRTLVPAVLSADHSYKEIPLVMGLGDGRAWAGLALVAAAAAAWRRLSAARLPIAWWSLAFLPAANLLFPIGTVLAERLAYLPSAGLALLLARLLSRGRALVAVLAVVAAGHGVRTAVRNLDWRTADTFYPKLVETSPGSAKSHYFLGALRSARGDDAAAVAEYDEAIRIYPAYSEAFHNRGNALVRLGRRDEAAESYRRCLDFDPGHAGAASNLAALEAGLPLSPPRRRM